MVVHHSHKKKTVASYWKYLGYIGYVFTGVITIIILREHKDRNWEDVAIIALPALLSLILHRPDFIEKLFKGLIAKLPFTSYTGDSKE